MTFKNIVLCLFCTALMACQNKKVISENYPSGVTYIAYEYIKDSVKHGYYKKFYEDNTPWEEAAYDNGKLHGVRKIFFPSGALQIEENYINDTIHGPYKVFYENGIVSFEADYNKNVLEGVAKGYYQSGKIKEEVTFANNEENGPFTEYYENGHIQWEGSYLNGDNEFGLLKEYNDKGILIRKMNCDSLAVCRTFWLLEES